MQSRMSPPEYMMQDAGEMLVYIVTGDEQLCKEINKNMDRPFLKVKWIDRKEDLKYVREVENSTAIILDIRQIENEKSKDLIKHVKSSIRECPPIIVISERKDIHAQLSAVSAGVSRYFSWPVSYRKLIRSIEAVNIKSSVEAYRVLLIDDEESLLTLNATILRRKGMVVETLSEPLEVLDILNNFKPDVIVIDMHMPVCGGPELAKLIRLNDKWALTPIMFLSAETDAKKQVEAMNQGADDFLVKPVESSYLFAAIHARAKRARKSRKLNDRLKETLRENKYQLITMDEHDIVSSTDVKGIITSVNNRFCEISGYSREELIGKNHRILKSGIHNKDFFREMWRKLAKGEIWRGAICNRKKGGEEYWVESTIVPFLDENGKPYKYVSARTDITELRKSEERLYRSQSFANIGTWDWNIVTGEMYWADQIGRMLGTKKSRINSSYENFIESVHEDDRKKVEKSIKDCIEKGLEYNVEHRVVWPDGSEHWVLEKGNVVRADNGEPLHMLGVMQNIDELKAAQIKLIKAKEEAESANQAKSQFLSSMSHELRTPLNAILGFGQLLKMEIGNSNKSQNENVDEILKAGGHLLDLINEVLDLSKIETGRMELNMEMIDLGDVISGVLQIITPLARKRNIEIKIKSQGSFININELLKNKQVVKADRTRLRQVLLNLISNAIKYNVNDGRIIINIRDSDNGMRRISVEDTGKGLTRDQQQKLFVAFERIGAERQGIEGTGIGLVITRKLVELMGGVIGVKSEVGKGSEFWVELEAGKANKESEVEKNEHNESSVNHKKEVDSHRYSVLYIEDNPANLRLVSQLFSREPNINLITATEPEQGISLASKYIPDLILMDINLPGMNGFEVLKELRKVSKTQNIRVIAVSANAMQKDIENGEKAGFDDYITKPIDVKELLGKVKMRLQGANEA